MENNKILVYCYHGDTFSFLDRVIENTKFDISSSNAFLNIIDLDEKTITASLDWRALPVKSWAKFYFPEISGKITITNFEYSLLPIRDYSIENYSIEKRQIFSLPEDIDILNQLLKNNKKQLFEIKDLKLIIDEK